MLKKYPITTSTKSALYNFILWVFKKVSSYVFTIRRSHCVHIYFTGDKERKRPELTSPQTFSYERHFGTVGLGQVNIPL